MSENATQTWQLVLNFNVSGLATERKSVGATAQGVAAYCFWVCALCFWVSCWMGLLSLLQQHLFFSSRLFQRSGKISFALDIPYHTDDIVPTTLMLTKWSFSLFTLVVISSVTLMLRDEMLWFTSEPFWQLVRRVYGRVGLHCQLNTAQTGSKWCHMCQNVSPCVKNWRNIIHLYLQQLSNSKMIFFHFSTLSLLYATTNIHVLFTCQKTQTWLFFCAHSLWVFRHFNL